MSSERVFVYGSLLDQRTLEGVLGHAYVGERLAARLEGYQRIRLPIHAYPFIVAAPGGSVDGAVLMDVSQLDLEALDSYEEVETGVYRRQTVQVEVWGCGSAQEVRAHTYVGGCALTYTPPC